MSRIRASQSCWINRQHGIQPWPVIVQRVDPGEVLRNLSHWGGRIGSRNNGYRSTANGQQGDGVRGDLSHVQVVRHGWALDKRQCKVKKVNRFTRLGWGCGHKHLDKSAAKYSTPGRQVSRADLQNRLGWMM